jgi:hypothetical protein
MKKNLMLGFLFCFLVATLRAEDQKAEGMLTVVPEQTDEILANPGMGWETFHHTSKQDRRLPFSTLLSALSVVSI